ncbi:MAG: ATP-binding cassette domain-containing protein [Acidimicrobiia bacterium]|nr:ATP-binding cassette domain-containing protein [Acidimicrobiia bacterium]
MSADPSDPARTSLGTRIDLDDVAKRYRIGDVTVTALEDVSLHVDEEAFVVILGPSGSGKTTLLNMIGALDTPSEGRVRIDDRDITGASRAERFAVRRETVSFVFQSFNLFPGLTALENVQFGAEVSGRPDAPTVARETLAKVGLAERVDHFPHQLSGGEQQRVAIARSRHGQPDPPRRRADGRARLPHGRADPRAASRAGRGGQDGAGRDPQP